MQFDSINAFFAMGGYGFYVWLSFGVSALLLLILIFNSRLAHQNIKQTIIKQYQREQKLKRAAQLQEQSAHEVNNES